ncbi:phage holin family protein [Lysobacter korlensis]|uniref:Phage holin family protein n=1 Tax=Lysobacter korlensis TaxID=553636 RepID=A0ABV6RTF5_9GAMM
MTDTSRPERKGLFALISDVPRLVTDLVKGEIELAKLELTAKAKKFGVGAGLIVAALVVLLLFVTMLLTAAVLGLGEVMPPWLAALLVALVLLIVAAVLAFIGYKAVQKALPPTPERAMRNLQRDVNVIKGNGRRSEI